MSMVVSERRLASAFYVRLGKYGDVRRHAQEQGICRQFVYREAKELREGPAQAQQQIKVLRQRVRALEQQKTVLEQRLARSVVLDEQKQVEFVIEGQARGVGLANGHGLLEVLIPGQTLSVPTLGRRVQAAEEKAGAALAVFDAFTRPLVRDVAADELYVNDPVRMVVEQESLCWISGHGGATVDGPGWAQEFRQL